MNNKQKQKITVTEVSHLASEIVFPKYDNFVERRDLIIRFLNKHGIGVLGKRYKLD